MRKIIIFLVLGLILVSVSNISFAAEKSDISGRWEGSINVSVSDQKLGIIIKFRKSEQGFTGTLDIPAQGVSDIPLDKIELRGEKISFTVPQLPGNVKFSGKIKKELIEGDFQQSGYTFPFQLRLTDEKEDKKEETNYAVGEYEIDEREVKIPVEGGHLAGTVAVPANLNEARSIPTVILVAGSGPTDRDGNNPLFPVEINTLKEIAHYLSSKGIITLRYDKRGIKGSSGLMEKETASFKTYRDDLIGVIDYAKKIDNVKKNEVYVAGHSEGAMLTIMAAESGADLSGLILISGSGFTHGETLRKQITAIGKQYENAGQEGVKKEMLKALDDLYQVVRNGGSFDIEEYNIPDEMKNTYLSLANQQNFVRGWLDTDPVELLEKIDQPVSIIQGTNDSRVGVEDAEKLASAVPEKRLELHIMDGINHFLKEAQPGNPASKKRIDSELLEMIYQFVK